MSFTEKQIREITRDELRRIIDAGLMYTFEAGQQISGAAPAGFKTGEMPKPKLPAMPAEVEHFIEVKDVTKDSFVLKSKHFLSAENFKQVTEWVKSQGGQYVSAGKDSHWTIPLGGP